MRLEELIKGLSVKGLASRGLSEIVSADWLSEDQLRVFFRSENGPEERVLTRADEARLEVARAVRPFSFSADAEDFRLAAEARRIRLAHLFDPYLALTSSPIEALPHQITAVYGEMLPRQPLRFLLADDPGAGKTIMAGLFIKELMLRGDLKRCLIVAPGSLVEQWEDELREKFDLRFHIVSREMIESSYQGNPFREHDKLILRLDMASRSEEMQALIEAAPDFDLVIVDEAHRMSASYFGNEVKRTKRFLFGLKLGQNARHLLLMTATPHNGKEDEFQLFLSLLDHDRFEGRPREGARAARPADLMRRMIKEELYWFDGRPLFPERRAYTVSYKLSDAEAQLYSGVTDYVREEMNRADNAGEGRARNNVGFALMSLQRRLASSPRAIWMSLKRRRERLQARFEEEQIRARGQLSQPLKGPLNDLEAADIEEMPEEELEDLENEAIDTASTARTLDELAAEIAIVKNLEERAYVLCRSGEDAKWSQLAQILNQPPVHDPETGRQKKILIFTEPRDTLEYLQDKIVARLGDPEAVKVIHGGVPRQQRRAAVAAFNDDPKVRVLIANDAAGEGVNLQRGAHLMVNYDLPWNPNRLEQRFGRIHRIGQTEVCRLWNLVAANTREGEVFTRLLQKVEEQRKAYGGRVFDVLGTAFDEAPLRDLLIEAIRYGDLPETRAKMEQVIDATVTDGLKELLEERALTHDSMSADDLTHAQRLMADAQARRLQPHDIEWAFRNALQRLGGRLVKREVARHEITQVPAVVRAVTRHGPVASRYERVTFELDRIDPDGGPRADLLAPGHPLHDAVAEVTIIQLRPVLERGTVLVSPEIQEPTLLVGVVEEVIDGTGASIARRFSYAYVDATGRVTPAGPAPHLDCAAAPRTNAIAAITRLAWLGNAESKARTWIIGHQLKAYLADVAPRRTAEIERTRTRVDQRLSYEVNRLVGEATAAREKERAGAKPKETPDSLLRKAQDLAARREARLTLLDQQSLLTTKPPSIVTAALPLPPSLVNS